MASRAVVICLDGCGPEYLAAAETPNLDALSREGWSRTGCAVLPTVTNVNNASILTGAFPDAHGITSNWYRNPETGQCEYMESVDFLQAETVFQHLERRGRNSALLTAKDKLRTLLATGSSISASAENPPAWLVELAGAPPPLYTAEVNLWLLDAALSILSSRPDLGFLYVTTTDYIPHAYAPRQEQSQAHLAEMDRRIGRIADQLNGADMAVTADHGMNAKDRALDLSKVLKRNRIAAIAIPVIRDRHVVHHHNLGGAAYVYLEQAADVNDARRCLWQTPGVEIVLTREQAAESFHLCASRIGDLMALGDTRTAFGELSCESAEVQIRSHGSMHEQAVPLIGRGTRLTNARPIYHKDLVLALFDLSPLTRTASQR